MQMNVCYREWLRDDCLKIAEIEKECFSKPWSLDMIIGSFCDEHFFGFVAKSENETVGYIGISCVFDTADVLLVAVDKKYRRLGIASELLTLAESKAKLKGAERMMLEANENNLPAVCCYMSRGYKTISKRLDYYGDGANALIMEKMLLKDI